jgi:site-specific DNA-methyltransferase (adenine-specific)
MSKAPKNRTIAIDPQESVRYKRKLLHVTSAVAKKDITDRTICQDIVNVIPLLPSRFVDLLIIDPPYNLTKSFRGSTFQERDKMAYRAWFESWFIPLLKILKPNASVYICAEWRFSSIVESILGERLIIRNRITWEREKGRGAKTNWKNCSEDIWFATMSDEYYFDVNAAKLMRRVIAPYRDSARKPKDWHLSEGRGYRLTHPSNLWTDITIPFWSMPENTEHPTQKPEKLIAKIILASSRTGEFVFDPFAGSGTSQVVAKKLGRTFCGVEIDEHYCILTEKRLELAETDTAIQGFEDGIFYERNSGK